MTKSELQRQRSFAAHMQYNLVKEEYKDDIEKSIKKSEIFESDGQAELQESDASPKPLLYLYDSSEDILFKNPELYDSGRRVCILNFADSISPGGGYLKGYTTQEEELCFNSTLYPVLLSFKETFYRKNRECFVEPFGALNGIYSPDIVFFNGESDETRVADVITVAAPNIGYYKTHLNPRDFYPDEASEATAISMQCSIRIKMIFDQAVKHKVTDLVLGAWGCGAFGNDPEVISQIFKRTAQAYPDIQTHFVLVGGLSSDVFIRNLQ